MRSFYIVKAKSSWTSMRFDGKSRRKQIESPALTKEYLMFLLIYGYILLMVSSFDHIIKEVMEGFCLISNKGFSLPYREAVSQVSVVQEVRK